MAHLNHKEAYKKLSDRINLFPQGAPPSELLFKILEMLFNKKEAEFISQLPLRPFTIERAAKLTKKSELETQKILEELCSRGMLLDGEVNGEMQYVLPPPMAGFFEFSMMRYTDKMDQKVLGELYYQYLNVEEDFVKELFTLGETQLGRVYPNEESLMTNHLDNALHVLDYEKASEVINTTNHIGLGVCYCRHKMEHVGKNCDAPMDICMTFNGAAESLIKHNVAKRIDKVEAMELLHKAYEHNLVQFGENVKYGVNFICHCCGCCCEALLAAKRFGHLNPVHTSNYIPKVNNDACTGCGKCMRLCPVNAIKMENDSNNKKKAIIDESVCLGCGVCIRACGAKAMTFMPIAKRVITPVNSMHRTVLMAIERGKLQNLIFDEQALWSHRAMAAILGVILRLPPAKQVLAKTQLNSRYLEYLITKLNIKWVEKR